MDIISREFLLTVHILAVILWIGFGLCELWLGRLFLRQCLHLDQCHRLAKLFQQTFIVWHQLAQDLSLFSIQESHVFL